MKDQLFRQHVGTGFSRNRDQTLDTCTAARNDTQLFFSFFCFQNYYRIDLLIPEKWKRLSFSDDRRRNNRSNLCFKIAFQIIAILFFDLMEIQHMYAILFQIFHDFFINHISFPVQFFCSGKNRVQLFLRRHIGFIFTDILCQKHLIHQRSHTYHIKFIQVALIDGSKCETFTQRIFRILSLLKYPFIKLQPG